MLLDMPVSAKPNEVPRIRELSEHFGAARSDAHYELTDPQGGTRLELPESLFRVLTVAARQLASGHSVAILHYDQTLTTQEAADLLQVSRPYLIRLLKEGKIAYHRVGTHRRIRMRDVLKYKEIRDERRLGDLKELIRASDALGMYEEEESDSGEEQES
jgi:excisionase family DNA binding protein